MRKSILMGTREDVIKRRAKQTMTMQQLQEFINHGLHMSKQANNAPVHNSNSNRTSDSVRRIVTFNHPCLGE